MNGGLPLEARREAFREDVGPHLDRGGVNELKLGLLEGFVEPSEADAVGPSDVAHGGIPACLTDADRSFVVVMEGHIGTGVKQFPNVQGRDSYGAHCIVGRHNFRFWCGVRHS